MKFKVGDKVKTLVCKNICGVERFPVGTVCEIGKIWTGTSGPYRVEYWDDGQYDFWWYSEDELELYVEEELEKQEEPKKNLDILDDMIVKFKKLEERERERHRSKNPYTGNAERFMDDAEEYLSSIFSCTNLEVPEHQVKMMAAYLANRMIVTLNDCLYERDREWKQSMKRGDYPVGQYEHSEKKASIDKDELRFRIIGLIREAYGDMMFDSERNLVEFVNHNPH